MSNSTKPLVFFLMLGSTSDENCVLSGALGSYCDRRFGRPSPDSDFRGLRNYIWFQTEQRRYAFIDPVMQDDSHISDMWRYHLPQHQVLLTLNAQKANRKKVPGLVGLVRFLSTSTPILFIHQGSVEVDHLDLVENEAREVLSENGFLGDEAPCVRGYYSVRTYETLLALIDALDNFLPPTMPPKERPLRATFTKSPYLKVKASLYILADETNQPPLLEPQEDRTSFRLLWGDFDRGEEAPVMIELLQKRPLVPCSEHEAVLTIAVLTGSNREPIWTFEHQKYPNGKGVSLEVGSRIVLRRGHPYRRERQWFLGVVTELLQEG